MDNMAAVWLPKNEAGAAGSTSSTSSSSTCTTTPSTLHLVQNSEESNTHEMSYDTLKHVSGENDTTRSSEISSSTCYPRISCSQTHKSSMGLQTYEAAVERFASASNSYLCSNADVSTPSFRRFCSESSSNTEKMSSKESQNTSNFSMCGHNIVSSENSVRLRKRSRVEQQHCFTCLWRGLCSSAFSSCSIFSSANLLSSTSQQPSQKCPSSTRKSSAQRTLLLLSFFLCAFGVVSSAENVVQASAVKSDPCPLPFKGERSKALLADVVIEGKVRKALPMDPKTGYFDHYVSIRKKILKGEKVIVSRRGGKPKRLRIGPFRNGGTDAKRGNVSAISCVASVEKGRTYFFYLKDIGDKKGLRFEIMAIPNKRTNKRAKILRDTLSKAKAPSIRKVRFLSKPEVGGRLQLKCNARGKPLPRFEWYKDGEKIQTREGVAIRGKKKSSKLIIKRMDEGDNGTYTCVVKNAVGEDSRNLTVSVHETCVGKETYCLNGGTCQYLRSLEVAICQCPQEYTGTRCASLQEFQLVANGQSTLLYERTLIIIGIVIATLVFIVICIASYILAKGRRKRFEQRRRRREAKRAARDLQATAPKTQEKHQANDVSVKESPLRLAAIDGNTTTTLQHNNAYPPQHEIHPLLLKQQQKQQQQQQQQHQKQAQQFADDEPDPQLQALLRSCDPNHQSKTDGHEAGERPDSRKRLVASSYDNDDGVPSTFKACIDRKETTTAAVLHTTEDIEMNNMESNGKERNRNSNSHAGNSGLEEDLECADDHVTDGVQAPLSSDVNSPPPISSPTSSTYSARPPSSGSLSPPPYHRAVYIPSPSHPHAGEDEAPEEEAAKVPLLASNGTQVIKQDATRDEGPNSSSIDPKQNPQYKRSSFQKNHAPRLQDVREWSSAPTPGKNKSGEFQGRSHRLGDDEDDGEREYDSDEEMITERDNLLGRTSQPSPPQNRKSKNSQVPSIFPSAPSVSHSNTFPKPSRVNGVVRGSSTSHNAYPNSEDESSSSDENDAPREFPYQKQRDDLYISEDDLDLSKENLASTSFSSDMNRGGRMSRQLSRQESRDMEEPVVGLLPSQNLKPPRDQLRKYPSEEGPAYTILACKAQGLHLQDDNRSKSLDDPLVSAIMAESSTNATASASSLSQSPYGSSSPLMSSASLNGNPHYNSYHYPGQHPRQVHQPMFEGGSRLHSTLAGSPMVETYGENDERFGLNAIHNPNAYRGRPSSYDPNEDGKPWDKETPTTRQDKSKDFALHRSSVEADENEDEKDRLQRLKDVYPDQPAIPI